ncbi:MAG TPA: hypothetical protein VKB79_07280 [Bryobacteraceae bacterium]|nr:hypothetical protein [Bryobacteraceae bacterium]
MHNGHLKIVVSEGKVTLDDLHKALDLAVRQVTRGGCNCGLTGFDLSFLRGDPALMSLAEVGKVANIQGAVFSHEMAG